MKREGGSKASEAMAPGGGDSPCQGGEGQRLPELPPPPPSLFSSSVAYFQPILGFEADRQLHVLIFTSQLLTLTFVTPHAYQ